MHILIDLVPHAEKQLKIFKIELELSTVTRENFTRAF
jgi:hypothetical protein